MKINFSLFNREFIFILDSRKARKEAVEGFGSRCMDGKHIIAIDYDRFELFWLIEEVKYLQETFRLGTAYIFESSLEKYHLIIPDKLSYHEAVIILKNSSVDSNYLYVPNSFGKPIFNIRTTTKKDKQPIKFIQAIPSKYDNREKSLAHIQLLNKLYGLDIPMVNTDEEKRLTVVKYNI